jgi:UrcA family protein
MKTPGISVGAALAVALFSMPASAQGTNRSIVAHINVRQSDLNLRDPSGAATMLARLEQAATKACGGKPVSGTSWNNALGEAKAREHRRCKAAAIDAATLQLGAPLVRAAWIGTAKATPHAAKAR